MVMFIVCDDNGERTGDGEGGGWRMVNFEKKLLAPLFAPASPP